MAIEIAAKKRGKSMSELMSTLRHSWTSFGLADARERTGTYDFSDQILPPIERPLDDGFDWLRQAEPQAKKEWAISGGKPLPELYPVIEPYLKLRDNLDFALPRAFDTFMQTPDLQARIRSCTACYLEIPDFVVRTQGLENGYLIHFLSDQQWCCHWNLYINENGEYCVLGSIEGYGFTSNEGDEDALSVLDLRQHDVWVCAPDFSSFIYRFWLENEIFFDSHAKKPFTSEQQNYIDFYKSKS